VVLVSGTHGASPMSTTPTKVAAVVDTGVVVGEDRFKDRINHIVTKLVEVGVRVLAGIIEVLERDTNDVTSTR
jgi:hypothetical protein